MIITGSIESLDTNAQVRNLVADKREWRKVMAKGPLSRTLGRYEVLSVLSETAYTAEKFVERKTGLHVTDSKVQAEIIIAPAGSKPAGDAASGLALNTSIAKASELVETIRHDALITDSLSHRVDADQQFDYRYKQLQLKISMSERLLKNLYKHYLKEAASPA